MSALARFGLVEVGVEIGAELDNIFLWSLPVYCGVYKDSYIWSSPEGRDCSNGLLLLLSIAACSTAFIAALTNYSLIVMVTYTLMILNTHKPDEIIL